MNSAILTILMLVVSNVFMTLAWYGHLRLGELGITKNWPLYAVILFSWGIALAEYAFQVPANRIGYAGNGGPFSLVVFTVVATFVFQGQSIRWNHIVAFLLLVGAVYFSFLDTSK